MSATPRLVGSVFWPDETAARYRERGLWLGQSLADWFSDTARLHAERTAVVDGTRRVSYRALAERVGRLAAGMRRLGIAELDCVVMQLPNSVELIETLLALSWLGAVPVLALPAHRRAELSAFCQRARAKALILPARQAGTDMVAVARAVKTEQAGLRQVIVHRPSGSLEPSFCDLAGLYEDEPVAPVTTNGADTALLQLSGGSTGVPKLIARSHDDYLYSVRESARVCELSPATRFLAALPMTHNFTLSSPGVLGVLHAGGTVVTCAQPHPEAALRLLHDEQITLAASVPSLARAWLEAKPRHLGATKLPRLTLQVGGARLEARLAAELLDGFGGRLQQVFGMAEGLVNYTRLDDPRDVVCETQGRPLSEHDELRVAALDSPDGPTLPRGELGELQTRGPYTIRGYFDDPVANSAAFTSDGFYRTGDVVRLLPSGNLVVEGRIGDRISRGGEKVSPQEIEQHLLEHPSVRDAAVVGLPDELLGQKSHAFVIVNDEGSLSTATARAFLRERGLAEFKLPDAVHIVSELPRTKVGKTDRAALRAQRVND